MISIFIQIKKEEIKNNLGEILEPFLTKCMDVEVKNLNVTMHIMHRNKILKALEPNIPFEEYNNKIVFATMYDKKVYNQMVLDIDYVINFKKSYKDKCKWFLKSAQWNSMYPLIVV